MMRSVDARGQGGRDFDLVSMGRTILDVYGEQVGCRMEEVSSFAKYVGGCPANIAIGASRLGLKVALIARVGDEQHGRFLREQLAREGVDVSHVRTDPARATGVAFLAIRDKETFPLLHYRDNCADMAISPDDYTAEFIGRARALLISGSHLTTPFARANIAAGIGRARARGTRVIFDIDYRPLFWGLAQRDAGESRFVESSKVTAASQEFLHLCDLVVGTEEEIRIAGGSVDTLEALRGIRAKTAATLVLKRGARGCVAFESAIPARIDDGLVVPGFPVDVFNVVGAGDGFMGGLLFGWLRDLPLAEACRIGNACGALVVSRHGCAPASPTAGELAWFLERDRTGGPPDLYRDRELTRLHRATTRRDRPARLQIVDCDGDLAPGAARVRTDASFKSLVAVAMLGLRESMPGLGIVLDHRDGEDALYRIGSSSGWVARPIAIPGRVPLAFEDELPAGVALRHWPLHHLVSCSIAPADGIARAIQDERLRELYLACQHYGHELVFVVASDAPGAAAAIATVESLHANALLPDWWQLPASLLATDGSAIVQRIAKSNPQCRGIVADIDGLDIDDAADAIRRLRASPLISGIAAVRALLGDCAQAWIAGNATEAATIEALCGQLARFAALGDD